MPVNIPPFTPQPGLANPHAQTIAAFALRPRRGVQFKRIRLDTPDGDFVDVDFAIVSGYRWLWGALGTKTPLVLVLHGLEGSARGSLAVGIYRQLARQGIRGVGLNFRSCSGEMNRTHRMYHSGATYDVSLLLEWLEQRFPDVPKGLVGFSLGANVALKYMGTDGRFIQAAAAISPPFDLSLATDVLDNTNWLYMKTILRSLKRKAKLMRPLIGEIIDVDAALAAQTFRAMDDVWQPLNGFTNAEDYYTQCSSKNFLPGITAPTLILRALDDPFFDPSDVPYNLLQNPALHPVLTEHGGHGGYLEKIRPFRRSKFWAERVTAKFLSRLLDG